MNDSAPYSIYEMHDTQNKKKNGITYLLLRGLTRTATRTDDIITKKQDPFPCFYAQRLLSNFYVLTGYFAHAALIDRDLRN